MKWKTIKISPPVELNLEILRTQVGKYRRAKVSYDRVIRELLGMD